MGAGCLAGSKRSHHCITGVLIFLVHVAEEMLLSNLVWNLLTLDAALGASSSDWLHSFQTN